MLEIPVRVWFKSRYETHAGRSGSDRGVCSKSRYRPLTLLATGASVRTAGNDRGGWLIRAVARPMELAVGHKPRRAHADWFNLLIALTAPGLAVMEKSARVFRTSGVPEHVTGPPWPVLRSTGVL